jgi:hypothetical protein
MAEPRGIITGNPHGLNHCKIGADRPSEISTGMSVCDRFTAGSGRITRYPYKAASAEFLGESDEKPFRPADIAEPIRVFILDYFAYELRGAIAEPFKRLVDVVRANMTRR